MATWRRSKRLLVGGAICALVAAGPCGAGTGEEPADPDLSLEGTRSLGPLRVRPYLLVKDVGYDDNIYLDPDRPIGDWTATAAPGLRALLLAGDRGGLVLSHEIDQVAFLERSSLDHRNSFTRVKGIFLLRKLGFWLEESYASIKERPTSEFFERLRQRESASTAGARSLGDGRLGWTAYARRERFRYGPGAGEAEAARRNLARREGTLSLQGDLRVFPKTFLTLEGRHRNSFFEEAAPERDARIATLLPGVRFASSAPLQGAIRIGLARLESRGWAGGKARRHAVGEGSLSARIGGFGRVKLLCARGLEFSLSDRFLYYVADSWSAGYEQFFSKRLSGEILRGRGRNDYPEEGGGSTGSSRGDRHTTWEATVRYRLARGLALEAVARRYVREATAGGVERGVYTIGTTLDF